MRKVRKTVESQPQVDDEPQEIVEFTHLITEPQPPDDIDNSNDEVISDALDLIKSEEEQKSKRRRPVRRKKSKD